MWLYSTCTPISLGSSWKKNLWLTVALESSIYRNIYMSISSSQHWNLHSQLDWLLQLATRCCCWAVSVSVDAAAIFSCKGNLASQAQLIFTYMYIHTYNHSFILLFIPYVLACDATCHVISFHLEDARYLPFHPPRHHNLHLSIRHPPATPQTIASIPSIVVARSPANAD
jgi:hypothetical protein